MSHTLRTQRNCILEILPSTEILMAGSRLLRRQRAYRGSMPQRAGERAKGAWSRLLPTADRAVTEHDGAPSLKLFLKLGNSLQSQPPVRKKKIKAEGRQLLQCVGILVIRSQRQAPCYFKKNNRQLQGKLFPVTAGHIDLLILQIGCFWHLQPF